MDDEAFGVDYVFETAQQFWSELEDILSPHPDATLAFLDSRLRSFVSVCATYHERYLSTPAQLDHSCQLLLNSDFFTFHSERSCSLLIENARNAADPHELFILYSIFLAWGRRHSSFFRSQPRWEPLLPLLMDYIILEFHGDTSSEFIESRLRYIAIEMLFELCRLQKLSTSELSVFSDAFIDDLFDLVEDSRSNELLSYSVIRFLVCLNEQFMVASVHPSKLPEHSKTQNKGPMASNRVLMVLMRRLHNSKSFGENLIFMLNRADDTPEDMALQLLILKMLYLLFTTSGTQEYFYTNDLRVLVDVFLRELNNLSDENESLKHTYLRVLYPLLTSTQLRDNPYKPILIHHTLQNFVSHAHIRDIDPTTRRLVDRCLSGDWCKNIPASGPKSALDGLTKDPDEVRPRVSSESHVASQPMNPITPSTSITSNASSSTSQLSRRRSLARSASAEILRRTESGDPNPVTIHNHSDLRDANGIGKKENVYPGPSPFSPLSRMPSIKARKGQGLTAHMSATTLGMSTNHATYVNDTAHALVDGVNVTTGGMVAAGKRLNERGGEGTLTPITPRSESGMISPIPSPIYPLSQSPPPPSVSSSEDEGFKEQGKRQSSKGSEHSLAYAHSSTTSPLHPAHERIVRPVRSYSLEGPSPGSEASAFAFTVHDASPPPLVQGSTQSYVRPVSADNNNPTSANPSPSSSPDMQMGVSVIKSRSNSNSGSPGPQPPGDSRPSSSGSGKGRTPPPPPPRRRKPPAPPTSIAVSVQNGYGTETIHTIARSSPSSAADDHNESRSRSPSVASSINSTYPPLPPSRSSSPVVERSTSPSVPPSVPPAFIASAAIPTRSSPLNPQTLARLRTLKPRKGQ